MNLQRLPVNTTTESLHVAPKFSWENIDLVFLDMDGTLLDKYFDDYFWEHFVPEIYSQKNGVDLKNAREILLKTYKSVENTLAWTDLDYWSDRLGIDITALKKQIDHLVKIHPHVIDFFHYMRKKNKKLFLVTNAHPKALQIKMNRVKISEYFEKIICSQDVGAAKEQPVFWENLQKFIPFEKERTFFADDTEKVLSTAKQYGIRHLLHIARPSSKTPVSFSSKFPSIENFDALID